eukprot:CAMPEP_0113538222 /NCGR_PEP_ID=MMETSP0015_2-20120614/7248_1 /TAXON_ID=2838 /ORGANISM="Odontella" /LENGTH=541 /DNA_ID=CAMNT_0000437777 /DNA_START=95 /DNA_END=1720 /DNA_ORIENTATION=+ /assembly_acc=CAM_ASM_000160
MSSSQQSRSMTRSNGGARRRVAAVAMALAMTSPAAEAFSPSGRLPAHLSAGSTSSHSGETRLGQKRRLDVALSASRGDDDTPLLERAGQFVSAAVATAALSAAVLFAPDSALAENELSAKYGGGFDSSLVDQNCLVDRCSLQAKACLADDPSCRKGLTCTAKCLGDNACITGCMARYGNDNLDNLLKCTIEDNECIKVAILEGGADEFGQEPRPPAPTVRNFNLASMEGSWFKVVGFNPNYDCYACQRNTFSAPQAGNSLQVDVEFSMPHLLPDGSPPPPKNVREQVKAQDDGLMVGSQSIGFNDYSTHETMVFDKASSKNNKATNLVFNAGADNEESYARTAHSEGEMFGLKFWENWYIIGENDADSPEFKFVYYNGKTRQNTYDGAFVYSRSRELDEISMKKVYKIAADAGMNPDQFCKIRNGCFENKDSSSMPSPVEALPSADSIGTPANPFRGLIASTKVSQLLGVEPVAAEFVPRDGEDVPLVAAPRQAESNKRAWWFEVGDYLENPHRHFKAMDSLRQTVEWPEDVKASAKSSSQ